MANLCENFPCHSGTVDGFSCEFCFCPEYYYEKCSGTPVYIKTSERVSIKDCSECLTPHDPDYVTKFYKEKRDVSKAYR